MEISTDILLFPVLVLLNCLLVLAEISLISARHTLLRSKADAGDRGASAALDLKREPNLFLSATRLGVTAIAIFSGAILGPEAIRVLAPMLAGIPIIGPYSRIIAIILASACITYIILVFGELVPRHIGTAYPERAAAILALPIRFFTRVTTPFSALLSASASVVLRLFPAERVISGPEVTEEGIRQMIGEGARAGVVSDDEYKMMDGVLCLGDRTVGVLMTPRREIVGIDLDDSPAENWRKILAHGHTCYPVFRGSPDNIAGVISVGDLCGVLLRRPPGRRLLPDIARHAREPVYVLENAPAMRAVSALRDSRVHMALVTDEYGGVVGLITLHDIIEAIIGASPSPSPGRGPAMVQREDGTWLLDGTLPVDVILSHFNFHTLPAEGEGHYYTLAGLVMYVLGKIPSEGDHFTWEGHRFEVIDMDGRRVDKVLLVPPPEGATGRDNEAEKT